MDTTDNLPTLHQDLDELPQAPEDERGTRNDQRGTLGGNTHQCLQHGYPTLLGSSSPHGNHVCNHIDSQIHGPPGSVENQNQDARDVQSTMTMQDQGTVMPHQVREQQRSTSLTRDHPRTPPMIQGATQRGASAPSRRRGAQEVNNAVLPLERKRGRTAIEVKDSDTWTAFVPKNYNP